MNGVPLLILVGANKGGVGKSTLARLLLDYANAPWRVIDGQAPLGSLKRFHASAEIVDVTKTAGQMNVIDGLNEKGTLVDVPAGALTSTLRLMHDLGLLADVANQKLRLVVLHVLGPSADSLGEAAEVAGLLAEGGTHHLIKNCATDDKFEWQAGTHAWAFASIAPAGIITIPHLDGTARERVDASGLAFRAFVEDEAQSFTLRRLVRKWLADCYQEFNAQSLLAVLK